jgi:hypothetical protein
VSRECAYERGPGREDSRVRQGHFEVGVELGTGPTQFQRAEEEDQLRDVRSLTEQHKTGNDWQEVAEEMFRQGAIRRAKSHGSSESVVKLVNVLVELRMVE